MTRDMIFASVYSNVWIFVDFENLNAIAILGLVYSNFSTKKYSETLNIILFGQKFKYTKYKKISISSKVEKNQPIRIKKKYAYS